MISPKRLPLLKRPCYSLGEDCNEYEYDGGYHYFAVVETPFTLISLIPVFFLVAFFRKHPETWQRVKADLSPSLLVLGLSTIIGLYVEFHLAMTDWLDMRRENFHCNLTFNFMVILGSMYFNFVPVALLIQLASMFFRISGRVKNCLGYSWTGFLILINLWSMTFGDSQPTIMCDYATINQDIFVYQVHLGTVRDFVTIALMCQICVINAISYGLERFQIRQEILKVDTFLVRQSLALSLAPVLSFLGSKFTGRMQHYDHQSLGDFMFRMFASSFFFGITASLVILFNYPIEFWTDFSVPLLCHRKEKTDVTKTIIL